MAKAQLDRIAGLKGLLSLLILYQGMIWSWVMPDESMTFHLCTIRVLYCSLLVTNTYNGGASCYGYIYKLR